MRGGWDWESGRTGDGGDGCLPGLTRGPPPPQGRHSRRQLQLPRRRRWRGSVVHRRRTEWLQGGSEGAARSERVPDCVSVTKCWLEWKVDERSRVSRYTKGERPRGRGCRARTGRAVVGPARPTFVLSGGRRGSWRSNLESRALVMPFPRCPPPPPGRCGLVCSPSAAAKRRCQRCARGFVSRPLCSTHRPHPPWFSLPPLTSQS